MYRDLNRGSMIHVIQLLRIFFFRCIFICDNGYKQKVLFCLRFCTDSTCILRIFWPSNSALQTLHSNISFEMNQFGDISFDSQCYSPSMYYTQSVRNFDFDICFQVSTNWRRILQRVAWFWHVLLLKFDFHFSKMCSTFLANFWAQCLNFVAILLSNQTCENLLTCCLIQFRRTLLHQNIHYWLNLLFKHVQTRENHFKIQVQFIAAKATCFSSPRQIQTDCITSKDL